MTEHIPGTIENPFKDDMTGRVLLGRYRIVRKLAAGGMGIVYLARTEGARGFVKPVVVKLILPSFSSDESFLKMFVREAQILSKLNDPGIVSVIDFEQEKNFYIMVLEYVHGFQLREWVKYREHKRKPLPTDVVIQIILKVLEPLHHAHTVKNEDGHLLGVVHQDISPSNILINTDGRVKLVDFGIARVVEGSEDGATTAGKGGFQGKLSYAAPERFSGKPATIKCDLYSVGVVLHQLLVGRNEFFAKSHANTIAQVLHHRPSSVTLRRKDAPPELDAVIQKALAKDPDFRFETALEFSDALRPFLKTDSRVVDEKISEMVAVDFADDMATFLGVEPLGLREKAWRKPSFAPPPSTDEPENTRRITGREMEELLDPHSPYGADVGANYTPEATVSLKPPVHSPELELGNFTTHSTQDIPSENITLNNTPRMVSVKGLAAIIITVLLAAGAVIYVLTRNASKEQKKIVLVQSPLADDETAAQPTNTSKEDDSADTGTEVSPPQLADDADNTAMQSDVKIPHPSEKQQAGKRSRTKELTEEQKRLIKLTSAFKGQKGRVKNCFTTHSDELANINQISFIFTVNASGSVQKVDLQPASINGTPLGGCVRKVATSTQFPPQPGAITFTIPVRVRL
ncbi:MAG: serine/threonine protein kinase [Deltaproteobacteria bacterium]|nr:serine/threonine protein kinase [Deltaproteobacteria bacterium]